VSNYPPGVTGNEPQITGEWPCYYCDGSGLEDEDEDGKHSCTWCAGSGIEPDEWPYCRNCYKPLKDIATYYINEADGLYACNLCIDLCVDEWERVE